MIRILLVHLDEDERLDDRLQAARRLARRFDALVVGLHVMPLPLLPVGYGEAAAYVGPELMEAQREANRERAERLERRFREALFDLLPEIRFETLEGEPRVLVPERARVADLVLVAQTRTHGLEVLEPDVAEHVAMEGVAPVLVMPAGGWQGPLGQRVLVGWNGSRQAARALHGALPFLATAREVRLVALGEEASAAGLEDAAFWLQRHGVEPAVERHPAADRPGARLLELARAGEADLLVIGAYGHSRLRELVLGGATRHILQHADRPVLVCG